MDKCKTQFFNPAEVLAKLDLGKTRLMYTAPAPTERSSQPSAPPPLPLRPAALLEPHAPAKTRILPIETVARSVERLVAKPVAVIPERSRRRRVIRSLGLGGLLLLLAALSGQQLRASEQTARASEPTHTVRRTQPPAVSQRLELKAPAPLPPPAEPAPPARPTITGRLASDALASGDLRRAAELYGVLAQREPRNLVYVEAARILAARSREAREGR